LANIVNLDRVSKSYAVAGPLLTDVSLGLENTDRVGVVGLRGSGKRALSRLLTGVEEPDSGRVTRRRDCALPGCGRTCRIHQTRLREVRAERDRAEDAWPTLADEVSGR
jgi:ATPase subunit of ABC transporter with duplicated ATPase domains